MKINLLLSLSLILFFSACEEEDTGSSVSDNLVLEAYLYAGQAVQSIRLSTVISGEESQALPFDEAQGQLIADADTFSLSLQGTGTGLYENESLQLESGRFYKLEMEAEGRQIVAETFIPEKTEVQISREEVQLDEITETGGFPLGGNLEGESIEITWDNPDEAYYYVVIDNLESDPEYVNQIFIPDEQEPYHFASNPQIKDVEVINSRLGMPQYGTYRVIVFRVNAEYAALFEDTGDSSQSLREPPSNVDNALGIFTGVSSDTVFFEVVP